MHAEEEGGSGSMLGREDVEGREGVSFFHSISILLTRALISSSPYSFIFSLILPGQILTIASLVYTQTHSPAAE